MKLELWIGLVDLKPFDRQAFGAAGAYTNLVTWAASAEEFRRKAEEIANTLDMFVSEVEDAEPLAARAEKWCLTEEIDEMILRAEFNPDAIEYGTFHTYPFDEA